MSLRERATLAGGILALAFAMGMLTVLAFEIVDELRPHLTNYHQPTEVRQ